MMSNEKPGGHGDRAFAAGAIDMAVWDATAKILGKPLWRVLSERYNGGRFDERVLVYSGGGYYYPGKEKQGLQDEMRQCRDLGYRLMKMKIGGASLAEDMQRIEWALEVAGAGENLAVDANGRFDLDTALAYAQAMERYGLGWFEEPVEPLDYRAHAVLCDATDMPIATGENLFSVQDFRNLVRHGGMRPHKDWLQPDPSLCYGLTECLAHSCHGRSRRLVAAALRAARRAPARPQHGGRAAARRHRELSRRVQALRRFRRHHPGGRRLHLPARDAGHRHGAAARRCSPTCANGWS